MKALFFLHMSDKKTFCCVFREDAVAEAELVEARAEIRRLYEAVGYDTIHIHPNFVMRGDEEYPSNLSTWIPSGTGPLFLYDSPMLYLEQILVR